MPSGGITIDSGATLNASTYKLTDSSSSGYLINNGTTNFTGAYTLVINSSTVSQITNNGTFTLSNPYGIKVDSGGTITNFTNNGTMTMGNNYSIWMNGGTITNFTNAGTMNWTSGYYGLRLETGTLGTFTNTGVITGATRDFFNGAALTFTTLNNLQGKATSDPLTVSYPPTNYNIIVGSTSDYGQVVFSSSGSLNFGIHSSSVLEGGTTYSSVIQGISSGSMSGTSGSYTYSGTTYDWTLVNSSGSIWDLITASLAPSAASTLASMTTASQAIASQFAGFAMSTNYANLNTYDCGLFDQDGGCFSVGGRYSDVNGNNNTDSSSSALVAVGGFKINDNLRVAGFIDQQANSSTPNGITLDNKGPMVGMSLVWNQHPDHLGYQVKVANAYQSKDLSITRTATGDAEAGRGDTSMEVQSYVAEVSYQFSDGVKTAYRPYVALRRAIIKQDGYTETGVDNPLTFNTLEDKSTTVIMGMKAKYKLSNQVTLNGALGVEHDVDNDIDKLQATSSTITGLTAVDINSSINKTRPVATMGATYHISPNQTLSAQTQYQELAYTSTSAKTAYVNYTVGF
ncbi:autotransporter outer membrane beta-barrel domain-containing protein [Methylophilaceae bacterium]|nr:autotransporter outer membrane beta-barrel domain-containing protein [Methylophilaceae bacterium]